MDEPHLDDEFQKHWPKLRAEFVLEDSDVEAKRLAGSAWSAAKKQAGHLLVPPLAYKIVTTEMDGYTVRYAIWDQDGPVLVTGWTILIDGGVTIRDGGGHPIPLAEAEEVWRRTVEFAKPKVPEPESEPQNLEEAVALLLDEVDAAVEEENWYLGDMEEAAEHVRRFLPGKS